MKPAASRVMMKMTAWCPTMLLCIVSRIHRVLPCFLTGLLIQCLGLNSIKPFKYWRYVSCKARWSHYMYTCTRNQLHPLSAGDQPLPFARDRTFFFCFFCCNVFRTISVGCEQMFLASGAPCLAEVTWTSSWSQTTRYRDGRADWLPRS